MRLEKEEQVYKDILFKSAVGNVNYNFFLGDPGIVLTVLEESIKEILFERSIDYNSSDIIINGRDFLSLLSRENRDIVQSLFVKQSECEVISYEFREIINSRTNYVTQSFFQNECLKILDDYKNIEDDDYKVLNKTIFLANSFCLLDMSFNNNIENFDTSKYSDLSIKTMDKIFNENIKKIKENSKQFCDKIDSFSYLKIIRNKYYERFKTM